MGDGYLYPEVLASLMDALALPEHRFEGCMRWYSDDHLSITADGLDIVAVERSSGAEDGFAITDLVTRYQLEREGVAERYGAGRFSSVVVRGELDVSNAIAAVYEHAAARFSEDRALLVGERRMREREGRHLGLLRVNDREPGSSTS